MAGRVWVASRSSKLWTFIFWGDEDEDDEDEDDGDAGSSFECPI